MNARAFITVVSGKAPAPPEGGWTQRDFILHGRALITSMAYAARVIQRKAASRVAVTVDRFIRRQVRDIIHLVRGKSEAVIGRKDPTLLLNLPGMEDLWRLAIEQVFRAEGVEAQIELVPPIQSTMAQAHSKVNILLGTDTSHDQSVAFSRASRDIASKITRINDTTRDKVRSIVDQALADGASTDEVADTLLRRVKEFGPARARTIARTELNNAWTQGAVASMKDAGNVTHVSVVGCESREEERWNSPGWQQFMYRGEGTCNIQDVPIEDADRLRFHPNHTGVIVPSRFVDPPTRGES